MLRILRITLFMFVLFSCGKEDNGDTAIIEKYLLENNISYINQSGVYVHVESLGSDIYPEDNSIIALSYTATYLNGEVFDKSPENTFVKINLKNTIEGLSSGLKLLSKDSKGSIYIPASLGFGANPPFGVDKNAILVYHVNIINILK